MDFGEYAAKETSELVLRLTTASAAAADEAVKRVSDEAQKAGDALRAQLTTAVDEKTAVASSLKDTQAELKDALGHLTDAQGQLKDTQAQVKDAQAQADRLRVELKTATERVEAASRQLDEARKAAEKLEAARVEVSAARDEQARARIEAETALRTASESVEGLRGELASAMKTLEKAAAERLSSEEAAAAAISQSQAAEAKLAAVTDLFKKSASRVKTLEQAQVEHERKIQDLESSLQEARSAPAAPASAAVLDDLLASFQALAAASTVAEVLTTLVEQLAAQFPRVALFRVRKGHLQGEHQIGFDLQTDIGKLVLPLGMDSLPSRAASSGQIERLTGKDLKNSRMPFGGTPTAALALPIAAGGETIAVVYADDFGAQTQASGGADQTHARYTDLMQQYAVAMLMRLTNELKTLAELRKYAVSLLNEIEQMYTADAEGGFTAAERQKRLAGNLDYARSIYGSRAALESADASALIDEELASLIDARHGTPFAHDLAAAAGHPPARSAAEAS